MRQTPARDAAGQLISVHGLAVDVTVEQEAADALRASEARLSTLLDAVPAVVTMITRSRCGDAQIEAPDTL